ncbi:hypothetical protein LG272_06945 [Pseudidiomarina marina]|uniref:Uncharacterized protein n=1 Tax=Pseudidiomarina marina TaxID=502366 RepID=A0A432YJ27_9GAMM|nr:hypothetical protein [Pseudidiomarina marina]PHR65910.1 MAG: hypothetical protein COA51_03975 [Idiomarina sp.]RUO60981.1 hypothetical protein CWI76_01515 [Pseudidiomarina marina]
MSDKVDKSDDKQAEHERERVFQISANRGRSRHKLRYVESSVSDTGDCRLCVGALSPDEESSALPDDSTTVKDDNKDATSKP